MTYHALGTEEQVDVGGDAYSAAMSEMQRRDYGTSSDDLKAYAEVGGAAAAAAGCTAIGAPAAAPLCASIGGAVAGKLYAFFADLFSSGPSDADRARLENSARFGQAAEITFAFQKAADDAVIKTYDLLRAAAKKAGMSPSNNDIGLWLHQNCMDCWYVKYSSGATYPLSWCYGCNTPPDYQRTYQDWGLPLPPGYPPERLVGGFVAPAHTTAAQLVAAQSYYKQTLGWIVHDLRAAAVGVLAKLATHDVKVTFNTSGQITMHSPSTHHPIVYEPGAGAGGGAGPSTALWVIGGVAVAGGAWWLWKRS